MIIFFKSQKGGIWFAWNWLKCSVLRMNFCPHKKGSTNYLITASVIKVIGDLNICILLRQRGL